MIKLKDSNALKGYQQLIADAIGTTDPATTDLATIALVEALMREERPTLDALSPTQFASAARAELAAAQSWAHIGNVGGITLADYCQMMHLDTPAWAL